MITIVLILSLPLQLVCSNGTCQRTAVLTAWCTGVATSSQTRALAGGYGQATNTNCANPPTSGVGMPVTASTVKNLYCNAGTGGVNASSGVLTVNKNGNPTTLTITFGTSTAKSDITHSFTTVAGDYLSMTFTTQATETLANVSCSVELW